ncbi:MAG TPA: hypothetical protein VL121_17205 [Agriterribacter sp.]|nr:hypothetical protein [Agriterribacter sp.]
MIRLLLPGCNSNTAYAGRNLNVPVHYRILHEQETLAYRCVDAVDFIQTAEDMIAVIW